MENTEANSEKMKNTEERQVEMWKDIENTEENTEKIWKIWKKGKSNSEKIWKIQKKIVKRYEKYGRKVGWIVYDMKNMEEK